MSADLDRARDILIIGAGIFGAAIAWSLARQGQGHRVTILERGHPAGGATSRAAALVTQIRDDPVLVALARETFLAMQALEAEGEHLGRHHAGALHVVSQQGAEALLQRAEAAAALGIRSERPSRAEVQARAPWLRRQAGDCAVFFPEDCYVDPYLLASAYLKTALRGGVRLMRGADVRHVLHADARVNGVELSDGRRLDAGGVINAAGAWANLLSVELGLPLPMAPVRSHYWITEQAPIFPRNGAIVFMPEIRAYARPEIGGLLFGIRERSPAVVDPRTLPTDLSGFVFDPADADGWESLAEGADPLEGFFPAVRSLRIAHYVTGPSNYTDDAQLILGASRSIDGLFVASGCNGSGITFSGGVGRLLAELVLHVSPFISSARFDPARHAAFDPYAPAFLARCAATRAGKASG